MKLLKGQKILFKCSAVNDVISGHIFFDDAIGPPKKKKGEQKGGGINQHTNGKEHVVNDYVLNLVETMKRAVRYQD